MDRALIRLAHNLGLTTSQLLGRLDAPELVEWLAYYLIDPDFPE